MHPSAKIKAGRSRRASASGISTALKRSTIVVVALVLFQGLAFANYKTITVTGYYSIALDGQSVWGGSSGNAPGWTSPQRDTFIWRFNPATGTTDSWSLKTILGMKGPAAFIVPLPKEVIVGISGSEWAKDRGHGVGAPDATFNAAPNRARDGGLIRFDRATSKWSLIDIPVFDVQGCSLVDGDLWLACGVIGNPRNFRVYRYNLTSEKLDPVANFPDCHCIAVAPQFDRAFTGTHHGNYMEMLEISTLKNIGSVSKINPPSIAEQVLDISEDIPKPVVWKEGSLPLVKAMAVVDDQLWVNEPMGAYYAKNFGGIACYHLPDMKCLWASPSTWQYVDLGDETALDLQLDPDDRNIIWGSGAKGLYKIERLPAPKIQVLSMDGLPDHNIQHIAVGRQFIWAGTEEGFLYRCDKKEGTWAISGKWQTGLTKPVPLAPRVTPGAVKELSGTAEGPNITLQWQPAAGARSYFILRDGVLVCTTASSPFVDSAASQGAHAYKVIASEGAYLKGGLTGPPANTTITAPNATLSPAPVEHRPPLIHWGTGDMVYVPPLDLYVDVYEFPDKQGEYPFTCVTWPQAKQLAALQGKRLPTNAEYLVLARGEAGTDFDPVKNPKGFEEGFWAYNAFNSRELEKAGTLKTTHWGIRDLGLSVKEWLSEWSPLGDGQTYGLAAGGCYTQVSFPVRTYAPYAEYPVGSWARNPALFNHSGIGFRCVLSGADAEKLLHLPAK